MTTESRLSLTLSPFLFYGRSSALSSGSHTFSEHLWQTLGVPPGLWAATEPGGRSPGSSSTACPQPGGLQLLNGKSWVPSLLENAENRCFPKDRQGLTPLKGMDAGQSKLRECPQQEKWSLWRIQLPVVSAQASGKEPHA